MASDLHRLGASLSLTEEEEAGLILPTGLWHSEPLNRGHFVVGRLVSRESFHSEALLASCSRVLASITMGQITFGLGEASEDPANIIWIGASFMSTYTACRWMAIGKVWRSSVQMTVTLDITKPLTRALKVRTVLGDEQLISFSYERLPNFCYLCGCLGHLGRHCDKQFEPDFKDPEHNSLFGWLRGSLLCLLVSRIVVSALRVPRLASCVLPLHLIAPFNIKISPLLAPVVPLSSVNSQTSNQFNTSPVPPVLVSFSHCPNTHSPSLTSGPAHTDPAPPSILPSIPAVLSTKSQSKQHPSRKRQLVDEEVDVDLELRGPRNGVGGLGTIQTLGRLIRENNPSLVFLAEIKCFVRRIEFLKHQLDLNGITIPALGKSGDLAVFWVKSLNIQLQNYSRNHIDISVELAVGQPVWRFTGIYREPDTSSRVLTWALLSRLHEQSCRPWLCAGDFNEILDNSEKRGYLPRPNWQMRNFRNALLESEGPRPWRFEAAWLQSDQCEEVVADSWAQVGGTVPSTGLSHHLELCQQNLNRWSTQVFRGDKKRIKALEDWIRWLLAEQLTVQSQTEISLLWKELEEVAAHEETRWKQRNKEL
ncbi:UNVERIFIED_CONTAM: hypothetical protein Sangu_0833500 [Sesamum angustifolium]|uniref:CCHC-type domain-containing protein n=1 Tax=Sesamum angustifolium TaxID=2727405 RepID=A0AAW2PWQ2_9LAMI